MKLESEFIVKPDDIETEDSGLCKLVQFDFTGDLSLWGGRLISYVDNYGHPEDCYCEICENAMLDNPIYKEIDFLIGKKVKVTLEVVE